MAYRAVKENSTTDIIAIGNDENQGGKDYNGVGVWCEFTFEVIPELSEDHTKFIEDHKYKNFNVLKVNDTNDNVILKTIEELEGELTTTGVVATSEDAETGDTPSKSRSRKVTTK